jgi:hypothetical protein
MIAMKKMLVMMLVGVAPVSGGDFLRELSADRPDATESPNTVEAGRFQIESSLWSYERDTVPGVRMETWVFGESNLKVGLTEDMDLQWVVRPWVREIERGGGVREEVEGFGDAGHGSLPCRGIALLNPYDSVFLMVVGRGFQYFGAKIRYRRSRQRPLKGTEP